MKLALILIIALSTAALGDDSTAIPQVTQRVIQQAHINDIRTALSGDFVPRSSLGSVNDNVDALGISTQRWSSVNSCGYTLYGASSSNYVSIVPGSGMSGANQFALPPAAPTGMYGKLMMDTSGNISAQTQTTSTAAAIGNMAFSSDSNWSSTTTGSFLTPTNLSITLATTGRPVFVGLVAAANQAAFGISGTGAANGVMFGGFYDGVSVIGGYSTYYSGPTTTAASLAYQIPCQTAWVIDFPSAGTHTYTWQVEIQTTGSTVYNVHCKLAAWEM